MKSLIKTITIFEFVGDNKIVKSKCIAINFFVPTGGNDVSINGVPLTAGDSIAVNQTDGYIDWTQYNVIFTSSAATNLLNVTRTILMDNPQTL
jgi:hypothetical protein